MSASPTIPPSAAPSPNASPLTRLDDPRAAARQSRLITRWLTAAGNGIALAVTNGSSTYALSFIRTERDTNYGVSITPNWDTSVFVTNKTTTGCTLNFGTAAGASAVVDVATYRSE